MRKTLLTVLLLLAPLLADASVLDPPALLPFQAKLLYKPRVVQPEMVAVAQAAAGTLVALANMQGVHVGYDLVPSAAIAPGTTVYATSRRAVTVTAAATGAGTAGQAGVPLTATNGIDAGMLVVDNTRTGVIPAGTVVLNASIGSSVLLSANITGSGVVSGDSLTFYPTVTLSRSTLSALPAAAALTFTNNESVGDKLRRIAKHAENDNPLYNAPLVPPPAYQASTAYTQGHMVSNNGNIYQAFSAGTTGSASAPTTTNPYITDGTVHWTYVGANLPASADPSAPTITLDGSVSQLTNVYLVGASAVPATLLSGGYWTPASGGSSARVGYISEPSSAGTFESHGTTLYFKTDAARFSLRVSSASLGNRFIIDGHYYSLDCYDTPTGTHDVILDFSAVGGHKTRTIGFVGNGNVVSVRVTPDDRVWWTPRYDDVTVAWDTDSLGAGSAQGPLNADDYAPNRWGKLLGFTDLWNISRGGTGYINDGSSAGGPFYTMGAPGKISQVASVNPELVVFMGSTNDNGNTSGQITTAALAAWQQLRSAGYSGPIVVYGVWSVSTGGAQNVEPAVLAAFQQFNDPNAYYVPIFADPMGAWIFGTGNVSAAAGNGNQDWYIGTDTLHPILSGIQFWSERAASAFRAQVLPAIP